MSVFSELNDRCRKIFHALPALRRSVALAAIFLSVLCAAPEKVVAQSQVTGQWVTLPYLMPINPIRLDLLRNGKVLIVAGSENEPDNENNSVSAVWDLVAQTVTVQPMLWDVFCNGGTFFADGRCMVVGGTVQYDPFYGDPRITVFDPVTNQFNQLQSMAHGRWYATAITLGDGRVMAWSGLDENGNTNQTVEIYQVGVGWAPPCNAGFTPPLYPWLHLLPDGLVFYSGSTPSSDFFDPSQADPNVTGSGWTFGPAHYYDLDRSYGTSVLLPLLPPNYTPRVMVTGGGIPTATATTEIIDLSQTNPAWAPGGDMPSGPRVQMNAVLLPNGKVLALGGSATNEDPSSATLGADLYDPATGAWSSAGTCSYARLYHSTALLLPDATVVSAGSNPVRGTYEEHIEIYSPAYLFAPDGSLAARPVISKTPAKIGYGAGTFQVKTPDAANIASVVLVRPASVTHAFNMEQRVVGLSFTSSSGALTVNLPPNSDVAPPGYYMLFLLNNGGVPSVATFVQVIDNPTDRPPTAKITAPAGDLIIKAGQTVNFKGSAGDSDGSVSAYSWYFPSGTPNTSTVLNPGKVKFPTAGTSVVSLTVLDNLGINNPSPPTRTIHVQPAVRVTNPTAGTNVTGNVTIKAKVIGAVGDANIFTFMVDNVVLYTETTSATSASCNWNTQNQGSGAHTLTVSVTCSNITDPAGNTGSVSEQVTVR
jgi:galactose oxidase-like protein/Big-like domain-containing protein/PKD domain-containing protein